MKNLFRNLILALLLLPYIATFVFAQREYPDWAYQMKVWPFDVLYPFKTSFGGINGEDKTSDEQIRSKLDMVKNEGANSVIVYIDDEQSYETFVDETGFNKTLSRIQFLVDEAHTRNLKVICYLNGLEVISVGATTNQTMPSLARNNPDWLQVDITGDKMVWYTTSQIDWIPGDSEDAWASPLSPWRDLFKSRLSALGTTGLDGVYIDATFLPGVDNFGIKWASKDPYFEAAFHDRYNISIPSQVDWDSENWRKFVYFRHEVIRDYLGELADYARSLSITPFFESSSCDFSSGTFLGNDVPFTISGGIACSPEIEPEGDYLAAFRMSKSTRDANQNFPMWFLGWPGSSDLSRREFAITLCHSGNYYPTAESNPPPNSFVFMDLIRDHILNNRIPFQNTVLIYPMRSKDYTFETGSSFDLYNTSFTQLVQKHIPFRVLPLETMTASDLIDIKNVVLAGAESISDIEYELLKNKTVSLIGKNGIKDKWGTDRANQLNFTDVVDISSLTTNLPFEIQAPVTSFVEYYRDKTRGDQYYIFSYNNDKSGNIILGNSTSLSAKVYEIDSNPINFNGTDISIPINDYLEVIDLQLSSTTEVKEQNIILPLEIKLDNYPNPFNLSTVIKYSILSTMANSELFVKLSVYDLLGKEVAALINKQQFPGTYEVLFDGYNLKSGIYFYKLQVVEPINNSSKTYSKTKRFIMIK